MIINRLAKGVREQDWFVVTVEILIVVIGIFIGLQVDDWNERRINAGLKSEYIQRLNQDILLDLKSLDFLTRQAENRLGYAKYLERVAQTPDIVADDPEYFLTALKIAGLNFDFTPSNITFEELRSSGRMAILDNEALVKSLIEYHNENERIQRIGNRGETIAITYNQLTGGLLTIEFIEQTFPFKHESMGLPDFNISPTQAQQIARRFASREELVNYLGVVANNQLTKIRHFIRIGEHTQEVREIIKQEMALYDIAEEPAQ